MNKHFYYNQGKSKRNSCSGDDQPKNFSSLQSLMTDLSKLQAWLEAVSKKQFSKPNFMESVKDGCILCEVVSKVKGKFLSYNKNPRGMDWMEKENLASFIKEMGILEIKVSYSEDDLLGMKKQDELVKSLMELAEKAKKQDKFKGPYYGESVNTLKKEEPKKDEPRIIKKEESKKELKLEPKKEEPKKKPLDNSDDDEILVKRNSKSQFVKEKSKVVSSDSDDDIKPRKKEEKNRRAILEDSDEELKTRKTETKKPEVRKSVLEDSDDDIKPRKRDQAKPKLEDSDDDIKPRKRASKLLDSDDDTPTKSSLEGKEFPSRSDLAKILHGSEERIRESGGVVKTRIVDVDRKESKRELKDVEKEVVSIKEQPKKETVKEVVKEVIKEVYIKQDDPKVIEEITRREEDRLRTEFKKKEETLREQIRREVTAEVKDEYESKIKLMKDAQKKVSEQIDKTHENEINALNEKHKKDIRTQSLKDKEVIKSLNEIKVEFEEKIKRKDFEYGEAIKDYKKRIEDLENQLTKEGKHPRAFQKKNSKGSIGDFELSMSNVLTDTFEEEAEEVEDEEDKEYKAKKELEDIFERVKHKLMDLELFAKGKSLKEGDLDYINKTIKGSLGLKDIESEDGYEILGSYIETLKGLLIKKEKKVEEEPKDPNSIIHSIVSDFTTLNSRIITIEEIEKVKIEEKKRISQEIQNLTEEERKNSVEKEDVLTLVSTLKKKTHNFSLPLDMMKKEENMSNSEKRLSTLSLRRFNTISLPQKTYHTSELPKPILEYLKHMFKTISNEGGVVLDKSRLFEVNLYTKKVMLLDKKLSVKKEHDGEQVLFLEKSMQDNKKLRITFLQGGNYDVICANAEQRERLYECISAIRPNVCYSTNFTLQTAPISAIVIHDKINGTVHVEASSEKFEPLKLYCGTWNMGNAPAPQQFKGFDDLFPSDMDIIAFAFQECDSGITKYLQDYFEKGYFTIASLVLWEIRLVVLSKTEHISKITNIEQGSKATGFMNMLGNKGGLGISFKFQETSLCFIGTHLAAHEERLNQRNQNILEIVQNLKLGNPDLDIAQFDHIFWMGDMNYRIDLPYTHGLKFAMEKNYSKLYATDQLKKEVESGQILDGFKEGEINFPPSYKYQLGNRKYTETKSRTPSYCDRVLYKSHTTAKLKQLSYTSPTAITTSDHSPVYATFEVPILRPNLSIFSERQPRAVHLEELYLSDRSGQLIKQPLISIYGSFLSESPVHSKKISSKKTSNPCFGTFPVPPIDLIVFSSDYLRTQHLTISIRDLSLGKNYDDQLIGNCSLPLENAFGDTPFEFNVPLTLYTKRIGNLNGFVHIKVKNMMG